MFNKKSEKKNQYMLKGSRLKKGYDWWWHSFTGRSKATGKERPFFIEFFIINPSLYPNEVVLGQSKENKELGKRPSYMMVKCGAWGENKKQLHRFFSLNQVTINRLPIEIKADDCYLSETRLVGSVKVENATKEMMCDNGSMSFDLTIDKQIAWNVGYGTSDLFRNIHAFQMYWHAQGMKSLYQGTVIYEGEEYEIIPELSYGYQDKNWGSDFTSPWVWLSSCSIYDARTKEKLNNSVFDIGGGRPKAFGIPFKRKLLAGYYFEGEEIEMNFSKFFHPCKTTFKFDKDKTKVYWEVVQWNRKYRIVTKIECDRKDMLFVNYEAPTGLKKFTKLYNGGNGKGKLFIYKYNKKKGDYVLEREYLCDHVGCEYGEFDKNNK